MNEKVRKITGSSLFPGATSVLLRWLEDNNPKQLDRAHKILFCKDWIRFKLTGVVGTDITDMSTSLLDIKERAPTSELFDLLGIEKRVSLTPQTLKPTQHAGTVTKEAADTTGLPLGIPIAAGAFDVAATAAGCGAVNVGDACVILGTTGCSIVVSDFVEPDASARSGTEIHVIPSQIITVSATMAATPNIDWIYALLHKGRSFAGVEEELWSVPAGCDGLIYHPYISSSGERAPFYSPGARAQFTGINDKTTPLSMTRAVYEGVALSIKDCLKDHKPKRLFLAGGGARSPFWSKIIADCTGLPIFISDEVELCARGSALMAGTAASLYKDLEHAITHISKPERIDPDPDQVIIYDELFKKYTQTRKAMMPLWNS
jgi:sugar (pentulose or hexulose) kinase